MIFPLWWRPQLFADLSPDILSIQMNTITCTATEKTENNLIDDIRPKIWIRISFLGKQLKTHSIN